MSASKFYAVRVGRIPGIYTSWSDCSKQVNGYSNSIYASFTTHAQALLFMNSESKSKKSIETSFTSLPVAASIKSLPSINYAEKKENLLKVGPTVIYVDGCHNAYTGKYACGRVIDGDGKDLLESNIELFPDMTLGKAIVKLGSNLYKEVTAIFVKFSDVTAQNNGAELLALVAALRIASKNNNYKTIYSDSATAISWSKKLPQNHENMDPAKLTYTIEACTLRTKLSSKLTIEKISGKINLADFGFHRS